MKRLSLGIILIASIPVNAQTSGQTPVSPASATASTPAKVETPLPTPTPPPPVAIIAPIPVTPAPSLPVGPDQAVLSRLDALEGRLQQLQQQAQQGQNDINIMKNDIANMKRELIAENNLIQSRFNEFGSINDFRSRFAALEQKVDALLRLQPGPAAMPVIPTLTPRY